MKLTANQHHYINLGAESRKRLRAIAQRAFTHQGNYYIYSPPGLGKTFTIEQEAINRNVDMYELKGNASMWAFTVQMALIMLHHPKNTPAILFIDDCDTLLTQVDSVNTMKIALAEKRLQYNKSLSGQYNQLEEIEQMAIDAFRTKEGKISIPLGNMTIIWASNYQLADQVKTASATTDNQRQKYINEEALRRRMNKIADYTLEGDILWGWVADCILNETPSNMTNATLEEKNEILWFMHKSWDNLKEHNISVAEKLYEEMLLDPDGYPTTWDLDYLVA